LYDGDLDKYIEGAASSHFGGACNFHVDVMFVSRNNH